jgi:hypothetical protein
MGVWDRGWGIWSGGGLLTVAELTGTIFPDPETVHPLGIPATLDVAVAVWRVVADATHGHPVLVLSEPPKGIDGDADVADGDWATTTVDAEEPLLPLTAPPTAMISCQFPLDPLYWYDVPVE